VVIPVVAPPSVVTGSDVVASVEVDVWDSVVVVFITVLPAAAVDCETGEVVLVAALVAVALDVVTPVVAPPSVVTGSDVVASVEVDVCDSVVVVFSTVFLAVVGCATDEVVRVAALV